MTSHQEAQEGRNAPYAKQEPSSTTAEPTGRTKELIEAYRLRLHSATDMMFMWLMLGQWIFSVILAYFVTPYTWIGNDHQVHIHLWAAAMLGGVLSSLPVLLVLRQPGRQINRYTIAISQACWSALLIHITGGRIETHFHVFGSLAFLAFYRDYRVLLVATVVVAFDHWVRGTFWPQSVFGVIADSQWRWIEHAAWVVFEDIFLMLSIRRTNMETQITCGRQAALENTNTVIEQEVQRQTCELQHANDFFTDVLNSVRANICILDDAGTIVATNQHWTQFARANGATGNYGVGSNYISNCRNASGPCGGEANMVADGIEAVIEGTSDSFAAEYPCHSPTEKRWFEVRVSPLARKTKGAVVIVHLNITDRKVAELETQDLQKQLIKSSHRAGMAEIATGVLHNVGNVLNSLNVSSTLIRDQVSSGTVTSLVRAKELIESHADDLGGFFASDPRGSHFPAFLAKLTENMQGERRTLVEETHNLDKSIQHIREIVAVQQGYAKSESVRQLISLSEIVEDAIRTVDAALGNNNIELIRVFEDVPEVTVDRHKLLQIAINFIGNAKHAVVDSNNKDKRITVRIYMRHEDSVAIEVTDTGVGIAPDDFSKIFNHGFTTKKNGHGFGLHSSANAAKAMGAELFLHSDGPGQGATFGVELPVNASKKDNDSCHDRYVLVGS